jgi:hypothetical protein
MRGKISNWRLSVLKRYVILHDGEMSEWSKVPLSKSGRAQVLVGSNPTLSARI